MMRTELPDGGYRILNEDGSEWWCDRDGEHHRDDGPAYNNNGHMEYYHHGKLHRLDGPAIIYRNGDIEYWVNAEIPTHILDIVIIQEEIDYDTFPSAEPISNFYDREKWGNRAYRISDSEALVLAILRYS